MTQATLIAHCGARMIDRVDLDLIPEPKCRGPRHRPVPHHELVETLAAVLEEQHLHIEREEYAIYGDGQRIFGVMDLTSSNGLGSWSREGTSFSLGLRGANDQSLSLQIAVGQRVFVCDNLVFAGDLIALKRKHTTGLRLEAELREAVVRYKEQTINLVEQLDRAKERQLSGFRAKLMLFECFRTGVLPGSKLPKVWESWANPPAEHTDVSEHPQTLYSLVQALTREARSLKPARKFEATTRIGRLLTAV